MLGDGSAGVLLTQNFGEGILALNKSMRQGKIGTKEGMEEVRSIVRRQMTFAKNHRKQMKLCSQGAAFGASRISSGACQPPKNSTLIIAHISTMFASSPIMNSRNGVEEYSTW